MGFDMRIDGLEGPKAELTLNISMMGYCRERMLKLGMLPEYDPPPAGSALPAYKKFMYNDNQHITVPECRAMLVSYHMHMAQTNAPEPDEWCWREFIAFLQRAVLHNGFRVN